MSKLTTAIVAVIALYCAYGYAMYTLTGDTGAFLPVPRYFGILVIAYWISLINDGIRLYKKEKKMLKRNRRMHSVRAERQKKAA